jgi:DNA-binding Lrp family transcriptional regulator
MGASPKVIMSRVRANRLTLFWGSVGRQNLNDGNRVSPVGLKTPLTFQELDCKLKSIMGKRKFTDEDLRFLLGQEGLSQAEIARKVGVSEQAVSWRVKKLKTKQASKDQDLSIIPDDSNYQGNPSIKNQLTAKELKFLELFCLGEHTIESAMIEAGYGYLSKWALYKTARRIVQRYEQGGPDAREVLRKVGFGELTVAKGINRLGQRSKSEVVQLRAHELAARILGMLEIEERASQGVTVIIQGPGAAVQVNAGGSPTGQTGPTMPRVQEPPRMVTITD